MATVSGVQPISVPGDTSVTIDTTNGLVITFQPSGTVFQFATHSAAPLTKAQWAGFMNDFSSALPPNLQTTIINSIPSIQAAVGAV